MMARFCAYADKVFHLGSRLETLADTRSRPIIPTSAVFLAVLTMFATGRGSLHSMEPDIGVPSRLEGLIGPHVPSSDSMSRIYALMESETLRQILRDIVHQLKRNKVLSGLGGWYFAAVDGHEFFASRKRCCSECQTRTLTVKGKGVTEYYHRGVVCHLILNDLAVPLDIELCRPGEGEETTAKRLLERVFMLYPRFFDVVVADALYLDAPFINFCRSHHKHVIVTVRGEHRLLLREAESLFRLRPPQEWTEGQRHIQFWDAEGFTSCEGVKDPLRVLYAVETVRRRQRVAQKWEITEEPQAWCWATSLSQRQLPSRLFWKAGHARWDIENDCFNTLCTHWALDHCFKHDPVAIVNFTLTLFIAFVLLQSFWLRNLKAPRRVLLDTLIALARELDRTFAGCRAPWHPQLARAP